MKRWAKWIPWAIALFILLGWIFGSWLSIVADQGSWMFWLGVCIIVLSAFPTALMMILGWAWVMSVGRVDPRQLQLLKKGGIKQRVVQLVNFAFFGVLPKEEEEEKEMS